MKTKYRIVTKDGDFLIQKKRFLFWANTNINAQYNLLINAISQVQSLQRIDDQKRDSGKIVWQSDQTEVKEKKSSVIDKNGAKEVPYNETLEKVIKHLLLAIPSIVGYLLGHWLGSHHF